MSKARRYKRAFRIACDLLNGSVIYGIDNDSLFDYLLDTEGVVSFATYEEFILNNLDRFSDNAEIRYKAVERLGW